MSSDYDARMGTTTGMWEMVSEVLDGEKLPASVSEAIKALAKGRTIVVIKAKEKGNEKTTQRDFTSWLPGGYAFDIAITHPSAIARDVYAFDCHSNVGARNSRTERQRAVLISANTTPAAHRGGFFLPAQHRAEAFRGFLPHS